MIDLQKGKGRALGRGQVIESFFTGCQRIQNRAVIQLQGKYRVGKRLICSLREIDILTPFCETETGQQRFAQAGTSEGVIQQIIMIDLINLILLPVRHSAGSGNVARYMRVLIAVPECILEIGIDPYAVIRTNIVLHQQIYIVFIDIRLYVCQQLTFQTLIMALSAINLAGGIAVDKFPSVLCGGRSHMVMMIQIGIKGYSRGIIPDFLPVQGIRHMIQFAEQRINFFLSLARCQHCIKLSNCKRPIVGLIRIFGNMELHPVVLVVQIAKGIRVSAYLCGRVGCDGIVVRCDRQRIPGCGNRGRRGTGQRFPGSILIGIHRGMTGGTADLNDRIGSDGKLVESGRTVSVRCHLLDIYPLGSFRVQLIQRNGRAFHREGIAAMGGVPGVKVLFRDRYGHEGLVVYTKGMIIRRICGWIIVCSGGCTERQNRGLTVKGRIVDRVLSALAGGQGFGNGIDYLIPVRVVNGQIRKGGFTGGNVNLLRESYRFRSVVVRCGKRKLNLIPAGSVGQYAVDPLLYLKISLVGNVLEREGKFVVNRVIV